MIRQLPDLKRRLVDFIRNAGRNGVTRSQLLTRFQVRRDQLDMALSPLLIEHRIKQQMDPRKRALGRPALRFYSPDVELELTPEEKPAMPILPFGDPPAAGSSPCQVCGVAIPLPEAGRPYLYCSDACRRISREGGATLKDFVARAADDARKLARVGLCLVMADLSIRGYQLAGDIFGATSRLIVHDNMGVTFLDVFVIGDNGYFPPPEDYESVAFVYRDGRIVYGGREPLIPEEKETP